MTNDERLDRIEQKLDSLLTHLGVNAARARGTTTAKAGSASGQPGADVVTDADLDSPRGNPEVRFVPKRWEGANCKGQPFSECPPEFLDMLAESLDYFAGRDDEAGAVDKNGGPKSRWSRLDAARARGWAKRIRAGGGGGGGAVDNGMNGMGAPPPSDFGGGFGGDDDIPFLAAAFVARGGPCGALFRDGDDGFDDHDAPFAVGTGGDFARAFERDRLPR